MLSRLEKVIARWLVAPSTGLHLDVLDGLRGLAILLVVFAHGFTFKLEGSLFREVLGRVVGTGWMGVQMFFVLSGFLISYPFFRSRARDAQFWYQRGYATRRMLKVFPPFYLVIVVLALFYFWRYRDTDYLHCGLQWALGVAHFVPQAKFFNNSFWSLWVELSFYLLLPAFFWVLRGLGSRATGWTIFAALLLVPLAARYVTWPASGAGDDVHFIVRRFPNALDNFAWGIWFAAFYVERSAEPERWRPLARLGYAGVAVLLASMGFLAWLAHHLPVSAAPTRWYVELTRLLPGLSAFLMLFFVFDEASWGARLFSAGWLRFVGVVSYEWFLLHQPAQLQFREWIGRTDGNLPLFLAAFAVPTLLTFLLAVVVYHSYSLPIMRWGRTRIERQKPVAASAGIGRAQ